MSKFEHITIGTKIQTEAGEMILKSYNGSIAYLDNFEADEDGNLNNIGERMLTPYEIGLEMRKVDGKNHSIIIDCEEE